MTDPELLAKKLAFIETCVAELRRLARWQMDRGRPGVTLQPTALVHEAYLRLIGDPDLHWNSRGHKIAADGMAAWIEETQVFFGDIGPISTRGTHRSGFASTDAD